MTLTDFLLARIAEDEAAVQETRTDSLFISGEIAAEDALDRLANPNRLQAECEAKRQIVGFVDAWFADGAANHEILRHLAAVYADYPDYRDEWRITASPG